jgi:hypothetical protein
MTSSNYSIARFANVRGSLRLFVLAFVCFAVFCTTAESLAQAVPPRVQTLQMIRPPAPPPEPPLQKEIRDVKAEVRVDTLQYRVIERENYLRNLYLHEPGLMSLPSSIQQAR